jgi:hypothetical protein
MDAEVEKQIGESERRFDLTKGRVYQLEVALRAAENALDRECVEFHREKTRKQIKRIEFDLASARHEMATAHETLEAAWALRNPNAEQNGEEI